MSDQTPSEHADGASGLLAAVLASCRDAIVACSLKGHITEWNRGAEEVFGVSRGSALGESISRFLAPDNCDEIDRIVAESVAGRAVPHYETQRLRSNGESFPAGVCGFPLRDATGEVSGFATIERDLSDRVRSADALREALATVESASQTKSRFMANVSHELRTPMNAILGMTSLALEEDMPPELRDYFETIRDSADTMVKLVNDVLNLSRFECDEFELEEVEFEIRPTIEGASKSLASAAHAKGLELVCQIAPDIPKTVTGDPERLRQVLTNLIGNAVKFTSQGKVVVEATPLMVEFGRCRIRLSVSDTGIGINEKDQGRIFAPFTQVDGSSIRKYGGSGLGLAITRHLVDCFGSKLHVESEVGRGSRFWFEVTLPLPARRPAEEDSVASLSQKPSTLTSQATSATTLRKESRHGLYDRPHVTPRRVLLVEDTPANRKIVQRVLQRRGHEVVIAVNGNEAINAMRQGSFDLVLMDVQMPIMDGLQATEAIRDLERENSRSPTTILAMTAHSLRGDRERCLRAGMNGYLAKPLDLARLLDLVENVGAPPRLEPNPTQPINARMLSDMSALDDQNPTPADLPKALTRLRNDRGLMCDMIGFFLEDSPRMRQTLRESHEAGDFDTLHRTAHSLKGLVANFDAHGAIEASRDLEDAAKNGAADAIPTLIDRVDNTCDELVPFLEKYRNSPE